MSRLRPSPTLTGPSSTHFLRVVASRTIFLTHAHSLPSHPGPAQTLHTDKCWLVASLGSSQEARDLTRELEVQGVSTRYCKVWEGGGVLAAWILHTGDTSSQSVINYNPLPDIPGDVGRRLKQGVEALIPHADVVFLIQTYAQAQSPAYANAPRAFLLALTRLALSHALLVTYWGADGAAALSVPTCEYFQSSGWTEPPTPTGASSSPSSSSISASTNATPSASRRARIGSGVEEAQSVHTGSGFWAEGSRLNTDSDLMYSMSS
ncbi:hypothetical protein BJV78DRAFT_1281277 [Lactifluus subvellereus]|nr:hypothetical protein BJV78DRAFT_1281277 [Lactifluus subvellereus]